MEKVISILLMFATCSLTTDESRNALSLEHSDTSKNGHIPLLIFKRDAVEDNDDIPNDVDNTVLNKGESLKPTRDGRYNQGGKESAADGESGSSTTESAPANSSSSAADSGTSTSQGNSDTSTATAENTSGSSSVSDSESSTSQGVSKVSVVSADNTTASDNETTTTSRMIEVSGSTHTTNESSSSLNEADSDSGAETTESDTATSDGDSNSSDGDSAASGGLEGDSADESTTTDSSVDTTELPSTTTDGDGVTTETAGNSGTTGETEDDGDGVTTVTGEAEEPETTTELDTENDDFLPPATIEELLERCRYFHPDEISIRALRSALALGPCRYLCVSGLRSWSHPEFDGTTCGFLRLCLDGSCTPAQDVRDITACREFYPGARIRTERPSLISGWDSECAYFCRNLDTGRRRIQTRPDGTPCGRFPYDVLPGIGLLSGQCLEGRCSSVDPESE